MTKQLTPLRRKDQATGYAKAVKEIVALVAAEFGRLPYSQDVIERIEAKFGGGNGQRNKD